MEQHHSRKVLHAGNLADTGNNVGLMNMSKAQNDENVVLSDILRIDQLESKLAVGQIVKGVGDAYLLYCSYAHAKGFSVRKAEQRYIGRSSELLWKEFKCSCEGKKDEKSSKNILPRYKKLSTRTNCKAMLKVSRGSGEEWKVTRFDKEHNHEMLRSHKTRLLRSSRKILHAQSSISEAMVNAGIGDVLSHMEKEAQGPRYSAFTRKKANNHVGRMKNHIDAENSDASTLIQYFRDRSAEDPHFYWNVQVDEDGQVMNFFFRDYRCLVDYEYFGDVISIDPVPRTKKCNLVCAAFVGINHHWQNVMFGLAFMSDETESSFEWMCSTFLDSMNGKEPETVFSDQCQTMTNAIEMVFQEAHHCLYHWHIDQDAASHLPDLICDGIIEQLWHKCMSDCDSEEEFEVTWKLMIEKHDLSGNEWLNNMYKIRSKWATAFSNDKFTAGLFATSRSQSTNSALKKAGSSSTTMYEFILNFEKIINSWRTAESYEDTRCLQGKASPIVDYQFLTQVSDIYTLNIYKMFESELMKWLNTRFVGGTSPFDDHVFELQSFDGSSAKKVVFDKGNGVINCSCHKFETMGILCKHALIVLSEKQVREIPERYLKRRWMKNARNRALDKVVESLHTSSDKCSSSDSLVVAEEYNKIDDFLVHNPQCTKTRESTSSHTAGHCDESERGKGRTKVYCSKAKATKRKRLCSQGPTGSSDQFLPFATHDLNQPPPHCQYPMQDSENIRVGVSTHPFWKPNP